MKPFLKWAGGKRWLSRRVLQILPESYGRYIEPFLGSGAVFFELLPAQALLSDTNEALIETYKAIRQYPLEISTELKKLHSLHSAKHYYQIRAINFHDPIKSAARFIYLNRTCWNGLYRVNFKNEFNVPIGTKINVTLTDDDFPATAFALADARLECADFASSIAKARAGDLIYVDPPYTVKHNLNGFVKYNQTIFSWEDQTRLHRSLLKARDRGCHIIMSNADHVSIRELYSDFDLFSLPRASILASQATSRGKTTELLMVHHG